MAYPFTRVVQHHEGAGAPSDNVMRFAAGGYSYGIGLHSWTRFRDPAEDYSTAGFNHVVVGVCLSGDRNVYPVTDNDILMMEQIAVDARGRGWLVVNPTVTPHREMPPPNNTICPGNNCARPLPPKFPLGNEEVWSKVVAAYQLTVTVPGGDVPADKDFVSSCANGNGAWKMQYDGGVETVTGRFYGSYFTLPANVRNDPTRRFLTMFAHETGGYSLVSLAGEVYAFDTPQ